MQRPDFYSMSTQALFDWVLQHDIYNGESICGTDFDYIGEMLEDEDGPHEGCARDELLEFANVIWEERYA